MTQTGLDSTNNQGTGTAPQSPASGGGSDSNGSDVASMLKSISDRLTVMERGTQSEKDRAVARVTKQMDDWKPTLEKLAQLAALTPEKTAEISQAMEYQEMREIVRNLSSGTQQSAAPVVEAPASEASLDIVKELGLDVSDPQVAQAIRDNQNIGKLASALAKVAVTRAQSPTPSLGSSPAPTGGGASARITDSEKEVKYAKLAQMYKQPTLYATQIVQLEQELA
jgi:hypothetical protein